MPKKPQLLTDNKPRDLITQKEVAALLNVHPITVGRWTTAGLIPCYRVGRILRYKLSDILNTTLKSSK
jgi:excisionase family DNA binding protein